LGKRLIQSFLVSILLLGLGCGRRAPLSYEASQAAAELPAKLQRAVEAELTKFCGTPLKPTLLSDETMDGTHLRHGSRVYAYRCAQCHGSSGGGDGPAATYLYPLPRDYRRGIFKFTSTPYGSPPRREDLIRTVMRGIRGTAMPSFKWLADEDREAVIDYVLMLTERGELENALVVEAENEEELAPDAVSDLVDYVRQRWAPGAVDEVNPLTIMPKRTSQTIAAGKAAFLKHACFKCHGKDGRGGSVGGVEVGLDAWGHKTAAADLTSGMLHGGQQPIDIYRRIYSGINGTPMPGFKDAFAKEPDTIWHLVHYILYLADQRRRGVWFDGTSTATSAVGESGGSGETGG